MTLFSKFTFLLFSTVVLLNSCKKDDPILEDENEFIHQVNIEFTDSENQNIYTWEVGSSDTILLKADQEYTVQVSFYSLDKAQNEINITEEILEESDAHQLFYTSTPSNLISVTYEDKDINGQPLGLQTSMKTSDISQEGKLRIQLKHYAAGKDGNVTSGSTDADVSFVVKID